MSTVATLRVGESGVLRHVAGHGRLRRRLLELGLLPGTVVRLVRVAPMGDPLELAVRNTSLSLRRSDAALLELAEPRS